MINDEAHFVKKEVIKNVFIQSERDIKLTGNQRKVLSLSLIMLINKNKSKSWWML